MPGIYRLQQFSLAVEDQLHCLHDLLLLLFLIKIRVRVDEAIIVLLQHVCNAAAAERWRSPWPSGCHLENKKISFSTGGDYMDLPS